MSKKVSTMSLIVAHCSSNGIGNKNCLPWSLPSDMKRFKALTTTTHTHGNCNAVIMGRKTYESLPAKSRPLPNRLNVILSGNTNIRTELQLPPSVLVIHSMDDLFTSLPDNIENVFIIGGESVYREALSHPLCTRLFVTVIKGEYECDKYFPIIPAADYRLVSRSAVQHEAAISFSYLEFERLPDTPLPALVHHQSNEEEMQYLNILRKVIASPLSRRISHSVLYCICHCIDHGPRCPQG
jgi:dihydrofolate reductase